MLLKLFSLWSRFQLNSKLFSNNLFFELFDGFLRQRKSPPSISAEKVV